MCVFSRFTRLPNTHRACTNLQLCGRTVRVDHVENYRLPKNLQEKHEEDDDGQDVTGPGQAYKDAELENKFSLEKGQDLFAPVQDSDDDDDEENRAAKKEAKRKRKEERQHKRDEKERRRREKEERKMEKEERRREKRARKMERQTKSSDDRPSKKRRYDSDSSSA